MCNKPSRGNNMSRCLRKADEPHASRPVDSVGKEKHTTLTGVTHACVRKNRRRHHRHRIDPEPLRKEQSCARRVGKRRKSRHLQIRPFAHQALRHWRLAFWPDFVLPHSRSRRIRLGSPSSQGVTGLLHMPLATKWRLHKQLATLLCPACRRRSDHMH